MQFDSSQCAPDPQIVVVVGDVLALLAALSGSYPFESLNTFPKSYIWNWIIVVNTADTDTEAQRRKTTCSRCLSWSDAALALWPSRTFSCEHSSCRFNIKTSSVGYCAYTWFLLVVLLRRAIDTLVAGVLLKELGHWGQTLMFHLGFTSGLLSASWLDWMSPATLYSRCHAFLAMMDCIPLNGGSK